MNTVPEHTDGHATVSVDVDSILVYTVGKPEENRGGSCLFILC